MSRIPDHLVEKVHLGEATPAERALVAADADASARLAALPAADAAFFAQHPVDDTVRAIEARARVAAARHNAEPRRSWSLGTLVAPLALAAVALMFVVIAQDPEGRAKQHDPGPEVTTAKGTPRLLVYRQREAGAERLVQGSVALPGDRLQVSVLGAGTREGVIVSVDGRGAVTLHWPEQATGSARMKSGEHRLPHAYELDDAPRFERFFLVTTEGQADVGAVVGAAEQLAAAGAADAQPLVLPKGYEQTSTLVRKVAP
jgi:hypothetical protein